jgi:antitoxin Phd
MANLANLSPMAASREVSSKVGSSDAISGLRSVTATDLKNKFGEVIAQAVKGAVAITRHERPEFVLLSVQEYVELHAARTAPLDTLTSEFDAMVARMNTPAARRALDQLFNATPAALGKSAVKAARTARAK